MSLITTIFAFLVVCTEAAFAKSGTIILTPAASQWATVSEIESPSNRSGHHWILLTVETQSFRGQPPHVSLECIKAKASSPYLSCDLAPSSQSDGVKNKCAYVLTLSDEMLDDAFVFLTQSRQESGISYKIVLREWIHTRIQKRH